MELQLNKKFDHLVLGPAAGQGLSNRLQCKGTEALKRTHSANSRFGLDLSNTFVTVFAVRNSSVTNAYDKSSNTFVGNTSYSKVGREMAVLNVFITFIQGSRRRRRWRYQCSTKVKKLICG